MTVFSLSIKYFKERLLRQLDKSKDHCSDEDIRWVLTVPAIWGEQAKQLMQESAEMVNFSITFIQVHPSHSCDLLQTVVTNHHTFDLLQTVVTNHHTFSYLEHYQLHLKQQFLTFGTLKLYRDMELGGRMGPVQL